MAELLAVETALAHILARLAPLPAEIIPTPQALGRVLAQPIRAALDIPPFANSGMDGYAVRAADTAGASRDHPARLAVALNIPAGAPPGCCVGPGQAARIMTGAPLPEGADAVVPVEDTGDDWRAEDDAPLPESVAIFRAVRPGANVRPAGEDMRRGQPVLDAGTRLRPQEIGVLVSLGLAEVALRRQPRVAILATGSELVDLGDPLGPGQIRNSNSYVLAGLVQENGGVPLRLPIAPDSVAAVRAAFEDALALDPDLIISSAGVSVGTRDVVRAVVDELGQVELWRVNLRPGKPLAFGQVGGVPFFGLPGNPVSAMVTFLIFVRPALRRLLGQDPHARAILTARVGERLRSDGRRSFLRVRLSREAGEWVARTTGTQSSGALLSMVLADGLLIVPEGVSEVEEGRRFEVWLLRDPAG